MYIETNQCESKQDQKYKYLTVTATTLVFCFAATLTNLSMATESGSYVFDQDMLIAVAELHGITEDQAIERLARETEAAIAFRLVRDLPLKSYAGSWFDSTSLKLKVAVADSSDLKLLEGLDVEPVLVNYSLANLRDRLHKAVDRVTLQGNVVGDTMKSYVDIRTNTAVLAINSNKVEAVKSVLNASEPSSQVEIVEDDGIPILSTEDVRGADGTRNLTWHQTYGGDWPCSIGASVEDGYVTAGHCGYDGNDMGDTDEDNLGEVQDSTWFDSSGPDVGYVNTTTGWLPAPKVNGYTDGEISVSAEWAGMIDYPVGSTLCRYGQTSGGPHCGTLDQKDVDIYFAAYSRTTTGLSIVDGTCTSDGDSGGTWLAGAGQVQGTHVGGQPFSLNDQCPTTFDYVFFQPIRDSLNEFAVTMLTSHGSNAPDITDVDCPDYGSSVYGLYICTLSNVDSQGEVSLQWTSSNGGSSTKTWLKKSCLQNTTISVTLQASNPYGTDTKYFTFQCPDGSN